MTNEDMVENRVDRARDKICVLQVLFRSILDMTTNKDFDDLVTLSFFCGLDEIVKSINYDLESAQDGGWPFDLGEYNIEYLKEEIRRRKEKASEPQPASEDSEANE